jgi:exosortase E/protease (VPEID-CTERM system)
MLIHPTIRSVGPSETTWAPMSATPEGTESATLPLARWAGLLGLLAAEILAISLRYDSLSIRANQPAYRVIALTGAIAQWGIAIGLAILIVTDSRCYRELTGPAGRVRRAGWPRAATVGNLLAFSAFYGLCAPLLEGGSQSHLSGWPLVIAWGLAGVGALVFWGLAVLPADLWGFVARRCAGRLAAGVVLGTVALEAGLFAQDQWRTLSRATLEMVRALLRLVFWETVCDPERFLIGTPKFQVTIAPQCSGYEGMGLIAALLAASLWLFRRDMRFPRALVLPALGMALIWLANAVRIAVLVALGTWGYPGVAVEGFHSLAGWALFLAVGLGLVAFARRARFFAAAESESDSEPDAESRDGADAAYLVPAMAVIATAMITAVLSPGFDRYYAARVIVAMAALGYFRRHYARMRWTWSWTAVATGLATFAIWMALEPAPASTSGETVLHTGVAGLGAVWGSVWLFLRVFGSVVIVPIAEELAFRGYLTRRLIATEFQDVPLGRFTWFSFILSSVLFGALHGRWLAGILAGMLYALALYRRGELSDAIVAHATTNGLIAAYVLTTGSWSLWT